MADKWAAVRDERAETGARGDTHGVSLYLWEWLVTLLLGAKGEDDA